MVSYFCFAIVGSKRFRMTRCELFPAMRLGHFVKSDELVLATLQALKVPAFYP